MKEKLIADLHCHPTMKPFYISLPEGKNSSNPNDKNSIWHYDPPTGVDKYLEEGVGVAKYSQSNFTAMAHGNVKVFSAALYALELGFIDNKLDKLGDGVARSVTSFVTGIPVKDLKFIEISGPGYTYFENLKKEHDFLLQLNGKYVTLESGEKWQYLVVRSWEELNEALNKENTLAVIMNIEGGHNLAERVLHEDHPLDKEYEDQMLNNLKEVKNWDYSPFYITVVHHFYNGISGNSKSFPPGIAGKNLDQSYMLGTPMTELGEKFIDIMLDDTDGNRILVDCKHLSISGRIRYYELLETKYKNEEIPILYTHAGVNGRKSINELYEAGQKRDWKPSEYCQQVSIPSQLDEKFNDWCINLFDDEIIRIARSKGLIGLEFDRRIAGIDKEDNLKPKKVEIEEWTELIWNNIQHIAVTLDNEGLPAWDCMSIGSDFDGIINTIYGIWTEEQLPQYRTYLINQISDFKSAHKLNSINDLPPEKIADKILSNNLMEFMKVNLKHKVKSKPEIA